MDRFLGKYSLLNSAFYRKRDSGKTVSWPKYEYHQHAIVAKHRGTDKSVFTELTSPPDNVRSADAIRRLIDDAKEVQVLIDQRIKRIDSATNTL